MNSGSSPNLDTKYTDSIEVKPLSIALIGPDEARRWDVATALADCFGVRVREFSSYPTSLDEVPRLLEQYFDVIIIDLDSDEESALALVKSIRDEDAATVMVYSERADRELMGQCMRAGAREYLMLPFDQSAMAKALVRARIGLYPKTRPTLRPLGKLLVFLGAKGGSGVTTIACNMAIALAQEPDQSTLLIDLAVPLGDAALNLGIAAEYSTDHALQDASPLDANLLRKILAKHRSGVSVLAAPSKVPEVEASKVAIDRLMSVARQEFDHVIVDVGSRIDLMGTDLFNKATTIYLVTQAGISELRNSNRLISQFFSEGSPKLEIVLNRFEPRSQVGVNEDVVTKALGRPVRWKIPDDHDATRQMQSTATALSLVDSPISRPILEMASSVTGHAIHQEANRDFTYQSVDGAVEEKLPSSDESLDNIIPTPALAGTPPAIAWSTPDPIPYGTPLGAAQLNASASVPGSLIYTPGRGYVLPAGTHTLWVTLNPANAEGGDPIQAAVSITVSKAKPAITWPTPESIIAGTALSAAQLDATASVPGTFVYSPAVGEVLAAGSHTVSVTFIPTDDRNYSTAEATALVTVAKETPTIAWSTPDPISYGTALSEAQLNATAPVPGTFVYSPPAGEVLAVGTQTLSVTFTPENETSYSSALATVKITVAKATPGIAWPTPDPIPYGTLLSTTQLGATASVPGTFAYKPGEGAVLAAGEHTPSAIFTPADTSSYLMAQAAVRLTVTKATPAIAWPMPDPIPCGAALGAVQLNATTTVPGKFEYKPGAGEMLTAGEHTLSVTFTPADTMNYTTAQAAVSLVVTEISPPEITWPSPSGISYGAPLSATQLNATAWVPGTFVYAPAAGEVLPPGRHTLLVTFTPEDTGKYATAQATVELVVVGLPNIDSLLAGGAQTLFTQTVSANDAAAADAERESPPSGSTPTEKTQRETRTYKGAIYEKGDDGQWHLQPK